MSTPARVTLAGVSKRYGAATAVRDLDVDVAPGSFVALLGPSGCGKSTTLAMIAGLVGPDSGDVRLDGRSMAGVPTERRPVSIVFQKPLLFPHLSIADNVAFGLRMRGVARRDREARVAAMLARVRLGELGGRRVGELSGGQEQRAALARALVTDPCVLLLDEPFSQLDPQLRVEMRTVVRELHAAAGLTTIFVTHDRAEAVDVADEIVLMLDGRVAGQGPAELFYRSPPTLAAARFFGAVNELPGAVASGRFRTSHGDLPTDTGLTDGPAVLVVRPETVDLVRDAAPDTVPGRVVAARFAGTHLEVDLELADGSLRVHRRVGEDLTLGAAVHARVAGEHRIVLREDAP